jgi:outer membrane receptor protein involved in Fe transport
MGDNGAGLPKPSLKSEKSATLELGSKVDFSRASAQLSLWYADYRDPILATMAGTSPLIVHENGPGYEVAGADATASGNWRFLSGKVCGTVQKARIRDPNPSLDGNEPRRTPRWKGSAELASDLPLGLRVGYTLDAQGFTWATELNSQDDYRSGRILHGIWLRWKRGPVSVTLSARNLTDVHTEDMEDLPLSGRQYQARLELDFARKPTIQESNDTKENTTP